jgi:hypothetical protein
MNTCAAGKIWNIMLGYEHEERAGLPPDSMIMNNSALLKTYRPPVVIGGVGGSGTRLFAEYLNALGFATGNDLGGASDNFWFTLLFKRREILSCPDEEFDELTEIFFRGMTGIGGFTKKQIGLVKRLASKDREQHPSKWLKERARSLLSRKTKLDPKARWGWKEPNSHIVLDRLLARFENMKYIHVVRNGLDMAHSGNQNQLKLWGARFIGQNIPVTPHYSLKYWCIVHRRILELGKSMGANFLFLNYDKFCLDPENEIPRLLAFLELDGMNINNARLLDLIRRPDSIGRFRQHGTEIFNEEDVAFVKELGFDIN